MADVTSSGEVIRFGIFELDTSVLELRKRGARLSIQGLPLQILAILAAKPGTTVTREDLRNRLWPADTFVDFDHSIRNAVARLREALDDSADHPRYIETLPRRGYRFIGQLEALPSASATPEPEPSAVQPNGAARRPSKVVLALIMLVAVGGLGILAYLRFWHSGKVVPIRSLAVLPLRNLSGDPSQDYLADGMTEELIGRLAGIQNLRVISRTSVMHYKDTQLSMPDIARTLQVDALVEGSVIRDGNRIRVHAQLIRGATDEHFWSATYDRELRDVLALESDVAQSIAAKVQVTVTGVERERLTAVRSVPPEVYESYLKGRFGLDKSNNRAEVEESISYFENAIKLDPTFAPAYVGLASAYNQLATVFIGVPPWEVRPKVIKAARRALELNSELGEAHALLADVLQQQWQWAEAEAEYKQALALNPNDAVAHRGLASWLLFQGRMDEALAWSRRARELDPLGDSSTGMGWILFCARRYDEAIHELRSKLAVRPDDALALWVLGFALIGNDRPEEAIPVLEKAVSVSNRSPGIMGVLAIAYAHAGRRPDALRLLAELKTRHQQGYVPAAAFITTYLGLGDSDQVFVWLEHAYQEQSNILQFLKVHPFFDPLRSDPRFTDLLRRVGLD